MSAYNILITDVHCSECNEKYAGRIQFKFGDTWQLEYKIGGKIKWGGNDIGEPNLAQVKVYGTLENTQCPRCLKENSDNEFDLFIEEDTIKKVTVLDNFRDYQIQHDGNFLILKK